ncbi:MAG: DUF1311 domain-containing protein [Desulfobacterales bacterium]|nr:DUF1311 domain-containing protein [Desulfobacterales bacterium]
MRNYIVTVLFLLTFFLSSVAADENQIVKEGEKKSPFVEVLDTDQDVADDYKKIEDEMNVIYMKLLKAQLKPELLKKAQSTWETFRDAECEYSNSCIKKGTKLYSLAQYACLIRLTRVRINDFETQIKSSCPVKK